MGDAARGRLKGAIGILRALVAIAEKGAAKAA
jgi:hypothetical protein